MDLDGLCKVDLGCQIAVDDMAIHGQDRIVLVRRGSQGFFDSIHGVFQVSSDLSSECPIRKRSLKKREELGGRLSIKIDRF